MIGTRLGSWVIEKELGDSALVRMERIARLRRALDDAEVKAPVHVFGALDPILSCMYFLAGAEIDRNHSRPTGGQAC